VIVRDGRIIGEGFNRVLADIDPTAHAEVVAIRHACQTVQSLVLDRSAMYANCQPCPMCLGAIMWSRLEAVFYVNTADDARRIGFDDAEFYRELALPEAERRLRQQRVDFPEALNVFEQWLNSPKRRQY
jgi:tRNA(Arg) A34 adenosine deaminase TadA